MKPTIIGALIGALLGFLVILLVQQPFLSSPTLTRILFPARVFDVMASRFGDGPFGDMMLYSLAYFVNMLIYAGIGFGVGSLFGSKGGNNE